MQDQERVLLGGTLFFLEKKKKNSRHEQLTFQQQQLRRDFKELGILQHYEEKLVTGFTRGGRLLATKSVSGMTFPSVEFVFAISPIPQKCHHTKPSSS